jgi:hypothetical protein
MNNSEDDGLHPYAQRDEHGDCPQCQDDEFRAMSGIIFWSVVGAALLIAVYLWFRL